MNPVGPRSLNTIFDYWRLVQWYKRLIAGLVLTSVLITGIVSKFFLPPIYEATATVLPARQEVMAGGISFGSDKDKGGSGGGTSGLMMEALGGKSGPSLMDTLQALLASRVMTEAVSEQLNLMAYYGQNSPAAAAGNLRGETSVSIDRLKVLQIKVASRDPKMAADIANSYVANLDRLNKNLSLTATKQQRLFLENRLEEKVKRLRAAEEALKTFQTENRSLELKMQAEAAMEAAAHLHGEIVGLEVELAALREYATPSHPMINQLQVQIKELREQLDRMEKDQEGALRKRQKGRPPLSKQMFSTFDEAPSLALDFLRLIRQVKVEETVYGMLIGMLEQARIAEAKDIPTIQVLDMAVPPSRKARPKTLQNVLVAAVVSLVLGIFLAVFHNYLEQIRVLEAASVSRVPDTHEPFQSDPNGNGSKKVEVLSGLPKEVERLHG